MKRATSFLLSMVAASCISGQTASKKAMPNPDDTQKALTYLLTISDELIPPASSCHGSFGQKGQVRVKDLLAMELSSLWGGKNLIVGKCKGRGETSCSVTISHDLGEAVSSAQITFNLKDGRARVDSLACVLSP
jgi:hypothetical protein